MKILVWTIDHTSIPIDNWLQYDATNRELYGLPMTGDVGSTKYQVVIYRIAMRFICLFFFFSNLHSIILFTELNNVSMNLHFELDAYKFDSC